MNLLKKSGIYLSSNILNALVPFLLLPILTRNLSPIEYGQIAMFQTLVSGLAAFTGLNTVGAASRRFYDRREASDLAYYNGSCIHILLGSIIVLFGIAFLSSDYLAMLLHIPVQWIFIAIAVSGGTFVIQLRLGQWQVREQAFKFGILQVSQSVFLFISTLFLLLWEKQGAASRVNALSITTILYVIICFVTLYSENLIRLRFLHLKYIKDALNFGVPLVPHILGIFFLSAVDRILINDRLGVEQAGFYMLGVQLSLGMVVFFDAINKALLPWLFRTLNDKDDIKIEKLVRLTYLYFIVVGTLGLLSFVIGPVVVNLVAGSKYAKATEVIGWLCLGQAFNGMYLMVTNYIFYAKSTGKLSLVTILCGVFNIILLLILMDYYGIVGVSVAFAISMCIRFLATWWLASRVCGFTWMISFNSFK